MGTIDTSSKATKKNRMALKVIIGLIIGIVAGIIVNKAGLYSSPLMSAVSFLGTLYLNMLKVMIYPLIFCAVVIGITDVGNAAVTGKIALKSIIYFIITTALASIVAVVVPTVLKLGVGSQIQIEQSEVTSEMTGILDMIANMIPANPVKSFAEGNVLQILVFAIIIGFAILAVGEKAEPVNKFFRSFNYICMAVIKFAVRFTPVGAALLIMPVTAKNSLSGFSDILGYVATYYVTVILFVIIVYFGSILLIGRGHPLSFFKSSIPAVVTAFATFSSTAALPVCTQCADDRGIRKEISSIVIPIGSTMNMDAGAIMLLMSVIFYCNILGIQLPPSQIFALIIANIFLSIGTPAIPNGGIATFTALIVMAGLPGGVMSLFVGAMSLCNTAAVNILGDLTACELLNLLEDRKEAAGK